MFAVFVSPSQNTALCRKRCRTKRCANTDMVVVSSRFCYSVTWSQAKTACFILRQSLFLEKVFCGRERKCDDDLPLICRFDSGSKWRKRTEPSNFKDARGSDKLCSDFDDKQLYTELPDTKQSWEGTQSKRRDERVPFRNHRFSLGEKKYIWSN